jgi:hypothetical protein
MEERHFRFLSWLVRSYLRVGESLAKEAQARTLLHQVRVLSGGKEKRYYYAHKLSLGHSCLGVNPREDEGADDSGGLGVVGMNSLAPNDLSLHLFTIGPVNEQGVTIDSCRNANISPEAGEFSICFPWRLVHSGIERAIEY